MTKQEFIDKLKPIFGEPTSMDARISMYRYKRITILTSDYIVTVYNWHASCTLVLDTVYMLTVTCDAVAVTLQDKMTKISFLQKE